MEEKLNIIEARKMSPYTEFKVLYDCGHYDKRTIRKIPSGYFEWSDKEQELLHEGILMAKFIPVQKTFSFMEVYKDFYQENKIIESVITGNQYMKKDKNSKISIKEIEGKWIVF